MLTIVEIRNGLENMAVGVERLWPTDPTVGVPVTVRIQNDLRVNEVPRGYALIQSLAKSGSSCHDRKEHLLLSGVL